MCKRSTCRPFPQRRLAAIELWQGAQDEHDEQDDASMDRMLRKRSRSDETCGLCLGSTFDPVMASMLVSAIVVASAIFPL